MTGITTPEEQTRCKEEQTYQEIVTVSGLTNWLKEYNLQQNISQLVKQLIIFLFGRNSYDR